MLELTRITFREATAADRAMGLLFHVDACLDNGLALHGLAVRRTRGGSLTVSFPARKDPSGRRHYFVRPLSDTVRRHLEDQILSALSARLEAEP